MQRENWFSSHPIIEPRNTVDELEAAFDSISYDKGAAVARMLEGWLGEGIYRRGIQDYIKKFAYKTATTEQLWSVLAKRTNLPVAKMMRTWTLQRGYPLITLDLESPNMFRANQTMFLRLRERNRPIKKSPFDYKWWLRIDCLFSDGTTREFWMNKSVDISILTAWSPKDVNQVVICNKDGTGHYRVNYPVWMWQRLAQKIARNEIKTTSSQRIMLIDDVTVLAGNGHTTLSAVLSMAKILKRERSFAVWNTIEIPLNQWLKKIKLSSIFGKLQKFIRDVTEPTYKAMMDSEPKTPGEEKMVISLTQLACASESLPCLTKMSNEFDRWLNSNKTTTEKNPSFLLYGFMSRDTVEVWNKLWSRFTQTEDYNILKRWIPIVLASTKRTWLIESILYRSTKFSSYPFSKLMEGVAKSPVGHARLWNWVRENWSFLQKRYGVPTMFGVLDSIAAEMNTKTQLNEMKAFIERHRISRKYPKIRDAAIKVIKSNILWMKTNMPVLRKWLEENVSE